jgi:hypothetical protein
LLIRDQVQKLWRSDKKLILEVSKKAFMHESFQSLLSLIIPDGVSDYFKLSSYTKEVGSIHIYMEEIIYAV